MLAAMAPDHAERVLNKTGILIQACGQLEVPILVSEQYPKGLGPTHPDLRKLLPSQSLILEKTAFGCLREPSITDALGKLNRKQVVLVGMETHVCVSQTAHQLLEHEYQVHVVQDAVLSRHKKNYKTGMAKMLQSGVIPASTEMVLFELLNDAQHPAFKSVQNLVK